MIETGTPIELDRQLNLLEEIEHDPDVSQASLATRLGVAVGTINWTLKRLVAKGYIKVKHAQRRKLRYIITPEGIAFRARLTIHYIETSLRLYRRTRERVGELLDQVRQAGFTQVVVQGDSDVADDIADICRLSCIERDMQVVPANSPDGFTPSHNLPVLEVRGLKVFLKMEAQTPLPPKGL